MLIRFYIDPQTDRPHVENHGVMPAECVEVIQNAGQDYASTSGARVALGQTYAGRYLKVVYADDREGGEGEGLFVITAYPLRAKELKAYRARLRKH